MYPREFFDTCWRPHIRDEVFVAMPFEERFDPIWQDMIVPAVKSNSLDPKRVDATRISGDIQSRIMDGIAHAKLILGELTCTFIHLRDNHRASPSGNVMYEIGLAHALRQDSEVILIASDTHIDVPFDIRSHRIHRYNADNIQESRARLAGLIQSALGEIDLTKQLKLQAALESLDKGCLRFLHCYAHLKTFPEHSFAETARNIEFRLNDAARQAAIEQERRRFQDQEGDWYEWDRGHTVVSRLFDLGVLRFVGVKDMNTHFYSWTPFGIALLRKLKLRD